MRQDLNLFEILSFTLRFSMVSFLNRLHKKEGAINNSNIFESVTCFEAALEPASSPCFIHHHDVSKNGKKSLTLM